MMIFSHSAYFACSSLEMGSARGSSLYGSYSAAPERA